MRYILALTLLLPLQAYAEDDDAYSGYPRYNPNLVAQPERRVPVAQPEMPPQQPQGYVQQGQPLSAEDDAYSPYANQSQNYQLPSEMPEESVDVNQDALPHGDQVTDEIQKEAEEQSESQEEEEEEIAQPTIESQTAKLQILDKINAEVSEIDVKLDEETSFADLKIELKRCLHNPTEVREENLAFLRIWQESKNEDDEDYSRPIFSGSMFSTDPALNAVEHPLYDITLLKCSDDVVQENQEAAKAQEEPAKPEEKKAD